MNGADGHAQQNHHGIISGPYMGVSTYITYHI